MRRIHVLLLVLVASLTACAAPTASSSPGAPFLDGTSWVVTHISGAATLADAQPTLAVADGSVHGNASCNSYSGTLTQDGAKVQISAVAMTAMACVDQRLTAQETAFTKAVAAVNGVRATAGGVELTDAQGAAVLTLATAPASTPKALVGTAWKLSGIVSNESVSSPLADTAVSLTFAKDALSGKACNTFQGSVTIDGSRLTVGPLSSTKMACPTSQESTQEHTVLTTLQKVTQYAIDGKTLTLTAPGGAGLVFSAT
jgi:heat shock protein HslJ